MVASPSVRSHARLALLILLSCLSHLLVTSSTPISSFSIPFTTYGPAFADPAAVARVNATIYGGRLPYPDLSLPVLNIATSLTLTGSNGAFASVMLQALPFAVDMINSHGGLVYNDTRYLLTITWASDDSSDAFLQLLYSQWLNDPSYFLFLMPPTQEQQVTVWPLVEGTNRTWTSILTLGDGVLPDYPYRFNMLPTWSNAPHFTLDIINARAQLYHEELVNGTKPLFDTTVTSPFGLLTMCLYAHNDSPMISMAVGVREWVNATNAARRAAGASESDLVTIVQDVFWALDASSTDEGLYQQSFEQCPDNVDVLVVCGELATADVSAVMAALAASLLRPKVAFTTSGAIGYNASDLTMQQTWQWWVTQSSSPIVQATLPNPTFHTIGEMAGSFAVYALSPVNVAHIITISMMEVIRAALPQAASLSSADLRAAFLAVNGSTFAQHVRFDDVNGNNDASVSIAYQLQSTGSVIVQNLTQMAYPAPFPWRRTVQGDAVSVEQQNSTIVVAVVISVLGCWVAQIMLEQAVYVKRRGGWYVLWLLVVAVALGGSGVWCAQFALSSAVTMSIPSTGALDVQWSLPIALLAWLPALLLTWLALAVGIRDFSDQSVDEKYRGGAAYEAKQARRHKEEEKRKVAALDGIEHLRHLARSVSRNVLAAAVLLTAAIILSRVALMYVWSVQAASVSSASAWVVSVLVCYPLVAVAVLWYFHALRSRVLAVFTLAGAIVLDWQVHLTLGGFTYLSAVLDTPTSLCNVLLSSSAVTLLCGVVAAVTCFVFVGLQFSRMQLSRNGLSVLVATMEAAIRSHRRTIVAQEAELQTARLQTDAMAKVLECIALLRPLHAQFSLALSSQANASTLLTLFDPLLDGGAGQTAPSAVSSTPLLKGRAAEADRSEAPLTRLGLWRASGAVAPVSHNGRESLTGSQMTLTTIVDTDSSAPIKPSSGDDSVEQEALVADPPTPTVAATTEVAAEPRRVRSSVSAWLETTGTEEGGASSLTAAADCVASGVDATDSSLQVLVPRSSRHGTMTRPGHSSLSASISKHATGTAQPNEPQSSDTGSQEADEPAVVSMSAQEANSLLQSSHDTHEAGWKQFENDVLAALQLHSQQAAVAHPHLTAELVPTKRASAIDMVDFSFLLPSITASAISRQEPNATSTRRPSLGATATGPTIAGCPFPTPSLQQLLQHPVCVEVVKDELSRTHSEENLTFYLHALRYRHLHSASLRRAIARHMYDTYIVDGSSQQINVSTGQRNAVAASVRRKGDDACTEALFRECEREVLLLMETNMKGWWGGVGHRMCVWLYYAVDVKRVVGWQQGGREEAGGGAADGDVEASRLSSSVGASLFSATRKSVVGARTE